jgi:hypothetical protein
MAENVGGIFTGIAGVHYVVSELSRRGLVALPTIRNCAGIDILVSDKTGKIQKTLQVKTSKRKVGGWPCAAKELSKRKNFYFVFLRWINKKEKYEVFMEKGPAAFERILENDKTLKKRKNKIYGKIQYFPLPKEEKAKEKLRRNWRKFGAIWSVERSTPPGK